MPHSRKGVPERIGEAIGLGVCIVAMLVGLYALVLAGVWTWHRVTDHGGHHGSHSMAAGPRDPRQPVRPAIISTAVTMTSLGVVRVTRYCATGSPTASGAWPRRGEDAATLDRGLPFGTVLWIDGTGRRVVTDRVGHGTDVDVYAGGPSCTSSADAYGVQHRRVATVSER